MRLRRLVRKHRKACGKFATLFTELKDELREYFQAASNENYVALLYATGSPSVDVNNNPQHMHWIVAARSGRGDFFAIEKVTYRKGTRDVEEVRNKYFPSELALVSHVVPWGIQYLNEGGPVDNALSYYQPSTIPA